MRYPKVCIVILNWKRWNETLECLESLFKITYPNYEVVIIDNGSQNDSVSRIKEYCEGKLIPEFGFEKYSGANKPIHILEYSREVAEKGGGQKDEGVFGGWGAASRLKLVALDENLGYAGGNNVGIRYAMNSTGIDFVLLLNDDTIVHRDFLTELIGMAESDATIGITGPKVYFNDCEGRRNVISTAGGMINMWIGRGEHRCVLNNGLLGIDEGQYDTPSEVDFVEGSCILIKMEVFRKIGLLSENFFAYWEESDFCVRAKKVGIKTMYAPNAIIWHKFDYRKTSDMKTFYMTRNRFWFMMKHATYLQSFAFMIRFFGYEMLKVMSGISRRGEMKNAIIIFNAAFHGLFDLSWKTESKQH